MLSRQISFHQISVQRPSNMRRIVLHKKPSRWRCDPCSEYLFQSYHQRTSVASPLAWSFPSEGTLRGLYGTRIEWETMDMDRWVLALTKVRSSFPIYTCGLIRLSRLASDPPSTLPASTLMRHPSATSLTFNLHITACLLPSTNIWKFSSSYT